MCRTKELTTARVADIALAVGSIAGIGCLGYALADSWGGAYWMYSCTVAVIMTAIALLRRHQRAAAAVAGVATVAIAVVISAATSLPAEPNPVTVLAFAVLMASAVRRLPRQTAAGIAAVGLAVVVVSSATIGAATQSFLIGAGWLMALIVGLGQRFADPRTGELVA